MPQVEVAEIDRPQLLRQARALRREYDVIVIDCPAKFADSSSAAIRVADFVLVPVQPSPFDVWASDAVAGLIKTRQEATGGAPLAACAISRAISNTFLQRSIGAALEGYGLPVLKAGTTQRVAYATTAAQGMTVFDGRRTVARREMEAVQEDVLREETRQLNVALPVELHQRLKVAAVQEGISVREWTARAVLYYFANAGA